MRRAPETTTLQNLVRDMQAARIEAGDDIEWYAYRLYHYGKIALKEGDGDKIYTDLRRQGAKIDNPNNQIVFIEFPPETFFDLQGLEFRPSMTLHSTPYDSKPGRSVSFLSSSLELELNHRFATFSKDPFAKNTFLGKVLRSPSLAGLTKKYPNLEKISFEYGIPGISLGVVGQTQPRDGEFTASFNLFRGDEYVQNSIYHSFTAQTELEPKRRRVVSWLPIEIVTSRPTFGAISDRETGSSGSGDYLSLSKPEPESPGAPPAPEVSSLAALKALNPNTSSIEVNCSDWSVDTSVFKRFTNLTSLVLLFENLDKSQVQGLRALRTLRSLSLQVKSPGDLKHLSDLPLQDLRVFSPEEVQSTWPDFSRFNALRKLTINSRLLPDGVYESISRLPFLEELSTNEQISDRSGELISSIKTLKNIDLRLSPKASNRWLGKMKAIESIWLRSGILNDETLAAIADLPKLKIVYLEKVVGLTDRNILNFARTRNLVDLSCFECKGITPAGFIELRRRLPAGFTGPERFPKVIE